MNKRNFCIIFNPHAGNGRSLRALKRIENALVKLPVNFRTVMVTNIAEAQQTVSHAIDQGEYIGLVGGDGTIRALAGILHKKNGVFAIIPAGRGNDQARTLNIPLDPIEACNVLAFGKETQIDMGEVNHHAFMGICSLGFDTVANRLAGSAKILKGRAAYLYGGLRALITWQPIKFKVTIDGKKFDHEGLSVVVANSSTYGGGMKIAPTASIHDGLLNVILIGKIKKFRIIVNIFRIYKGTHIDEPGFTMLYGRHIRVETDRKYTIIADGDFISPPPADIKIVPKGLRVLVP